MVETLAVERSQNDGTEGSPSALMVDMVDGPSCQSEPSTIDEAAPRGRGRPTRPRRVRRASTSPSTARKWAYGRLPCAAFRAVAWRARAPVGRRPLFGRGASRRRKRAVVSENGPWSPWETLCLHAWGVATKRRDSWLVNEQRDGA